MSRYVGYRANLTIICPTHGQFNQMPVQHLARKKGCQKCAGSAKSTTAEFIAAARLVHDNKFDYSQVIYRNNHTKIKIVCPEHGVFEQIPMGHLRGHGCATCKGVKKGDTESFINKARAVHGDEYNYSQVNYVSAHIPVAISCPIHGEFKQKPYSHLNGARCLECYGNPLETNESFIEKAQEIHGEKYDYSKLKYKNGQSNIIITCTEHGEFKQKPNSHLNGRGCPDCAEFGFNPSKPAIVYYLRVANPAGGSLYKIGVTNTNVKKRFKAQDQPLITEIQTWKYKQGIDALTHESAVLKRFRQYRYKGPAILTNGNTEMFINDVLELDSVSPNRSP